MELSPLAREKLARAGELSAAEKENLKHAEELTTILSDFFTLKLDNEGLWLKLKKFKDEGQENLVRETQLRIISTLNLGISDFDLDRYGSGLLGLETLKETQRYSEIENNLNNIKKLRQQYQQEKTSKFTAIKDSIRLQVKMAAQKIAAQQGRNNAAVDVEGSIEATARSSPQWRDFSSKFEKASNQKFADILAKLKQYV